MWGKMCTSIGDGLFLHLFPHKWLFFKCTVVVYRIIILRLRLQSQACNRVDDRNDWKRVPIIGQQMLKAVVCIVGHVNAPTVIWCATNVARDVHSVGVTCNYVIKTWLAKTKTKIRHIKTETTTIKKWSWTFTSKPDCCVVTPAWAVSFVAFFVLAITGRLFLKAHILLPFWPMTSGSVLLAPHELLF